MLRFLHPRRIAPVFVCPLGDAGVLSKRLRAGLLVSISDPERRSITAERLGNLRTKICPLDFHDIERDAPDMIAPNASHISGCLTALSKVRQHKTVLVHCQAGISRSSAIALILATSRHIKAGQSPDRAIELGVSQIRAATPHARPNMKIIELGADALELRATNFIDLAWELHRSGI